MDIDDILDSFDLAESFRNLKSKSKSDMVAGRQINASALTEVQLNRRRDAMNTLYSRLGSDVEAGYQPREQLRSPPVMKEVGIAALLAAQAHLGHATALWNPITQPYIYGFRNGIHIFDLNLTLAHLRRAAEIVKGVAQNDGNILFVGTRDGQKRSVVEAARRAEGYHVFDRWIPGTITNGKQVVGHGRVKQLITKHERNQNPADNALIKPNSVTPDLVIILNPLENRNLIKECAKGRVPTIGIIDSDADPRWITYSIPGNDDSLRFTGLVAGVLSRAAAEGRQKMALPGWIQEEVEEKVMAEA